MKNLKSKVVLLGASLLLWGCGNATSQVNTTLQDVQDTLPTVIQHLNDIQSVEGQLQSDWEAEISQDLEMETFQTGKGAVFENIAKRKESFKQLKEQTNKLATYSESLAKVKEESLPLTELQIITGSLNQIVTALNDYLTLAEPQLENELVFFKSLSGQTITYDSLNAEIVNINNQAMERQAILAILNDPLKNIDKPIRIAKARLATQLESSK